MSQQPPAKPTLAGATDFEAIRALYTEDIAQTGVSVLLTGHFGSGKTWFLQTCPRPIWIDVFDPGGAKGLRDVIAKDDQIVADVRWMRDDPMKPTVFEAWSAEMKKRFATGFFDKLGTYVIDSATSHMQVISNQVMFKRGAPGTFPGSNKKEAYEQEWRPIKEKVALGYEQILSQKCHVIVTGHLHEIYKGRGDDRQISGYRFKTVGDLAVYLPLKFSEVWVLDAKKVAPGPQHPDGIKREILTASVGLYNCRSRLSAGGKLAQREDPDFKAILRKVGYPDTDKPRI